jgi:OmcA/MtrC family decaheme c-type cytochrome
MRIPPYIGRLCKLAVVITVVALSVMTAGSRSNYLTPKDKAFYADENLINFVRPGLVLRVVSGAIADDGTITARVRITDPRGLPLDRLGVTTPGPVAISCMAAYIPQGQTQYVAYTTRIQTSPITNRSATQAAADSGGTWAQVDGEYTYTFRTKAPTNFQKGSTHSVACQATRNLAEFDMPNNYQDNVFTWVPNGSPVTVTRDVIKTATCNSCHDQVAFHGGARRSMEYCVMCHTPQTTDPDTGNTVDMTVMTHKIHMGARLPSVIAGGKYSIIGFGQNEVDYSHVVLPIDPGNCMVCHEQGKGAAQEKAFLKATRAACGACHDDVNFATGQGHVNLPQVSDNNCSTCHIAQGELPLDASILGAHVPTNAALIHPDRFDWIPGMVFSNLRVTGSAGQRASITFTLKDKAGNPIDLNSLKAAPGRLFAVMAGPTTDYGYTNFGTGVTSAGYFSEDIANGNGTCDQSGNCSYTFNRIVPADAKGTFTVGLEGRRTVTINPGTNKQRVVQYGAKNVVAHFSVDGSAVVARRQVVSNEKCNACHDFLSLHGQNRNQIEQCVLCHNPGETDKAVRPVAQTPAERAKPAASIDFAYMVHRIHTGKELVPQGAGYTILGRGGAVYDYTHVGYPAFSPSGAVGDTRNCAMCHVNGSENILPSGKVPVEHPQSPVNPLPRVTAACTGCHASMPTLAHAVNNTAMIGGKPVEACATCHGPNSHYSVVRAHAR